MRTHTDESICHVCESSRYTDFKSNPDLVNLSSPFTFEG